MKFNLLFILAIYFTGCASIKHLPIEVQESHLLIEKYQECLTEKGENKLLADKECNPILHNKKIFMIVDEISTTYGLTVKGRVGRNIILCRPHKLYEIVLKVKPDIIKMNEVYGFTGHRKGVGNYSGILSFNNCDFHIPNISNPKKDKG